MRIPLCIMCALLPLAAGADQVLIVSDEWPQMEVFGAYLETQGYEIDKAEQDKVPNDLDGYAGVIQFVHGKLNDDSAAKLMAYAENGGRLIVVHHGISSGKKKTKGWYDFLGVDEHYKMHWADSVRPHGHVWVYRSQPDLAAVHFLRFRLRPFLKRRLPWLVAIKRRLRGSS